MTMDYDAVLAHVLTLLQQEQRVAYRVLKRRLQLDDETLEDLKDDLIYAKKLAIDEDNRVLVWAGQQEGALAPPPVPRTPEPASAPAPDQAREPLSYTPRHLAEKILTSRSALEGERKQVTVLFADVAGFTTLAEQLDPEVVHDIINRCFEGITAEVHRFEGTINQYTGDGVMALFGAPLAHEDSPRRAVHAALGIQRAIRDAAQTLHAERGLSLQMRIGINTGLVVVGKIGDDLRMDYTAVGDTTNLAARLQQMAQPGSVVISATTQQHIAGFFEMRDLGEMPVKGRAPVRAFEVLKPRHRRARFAVAVERGLDPPRGARAGSRAASGALGTGEGRHWTGGAAQWRSGDRQIAPRAGAHGTGGQRAAGVADAVSVFALLPPYQLVSPDRSARADGPAL
jgi:class 3 adenylate cyclase